MDKLILLKNANIINLEKRSVDPGEILLRQGEHGYYAVNQGRGLKLPDSAGSATTIINVDGALMLPAFTDIRPVIGKLGSTGAKSELISAMRSGYGLLCPSPVKDDIPETPLLFEGYKKRCEASLFPELIPSAPITKRFMTSQLTDIEGLMKMGCTVFYEDPDSHTPPSIRFEAMKRLGKTGCLLILKSSDKSFDNGDVNSGSVSKSLGLRGISRSSELCTVSEDLIMAEETGCRIHITGISLKKSVEMIREAKSRGISVTVSTSPQYFSLTENEVLFMGAMAKLMPPLRCEEDRQGILEGIRDKTIDCISGDHISIPKSAKKTIENAEFGSSGFETAFAAGITHLVRTSVIDIYDLVRLMSTKPLEILRGEGAMFTGVIAVDTRKGRRFSKSTVSSQNWNSVFDGAFLYGAVLKNYIN